MMEQKKKQLKSASILVLIFAGLSLVKIIAELILTDLNVTTIPEGLPENILLITKIVFAVISVLLLIPNVYIGIKGLKLASNPDSSTKAHIIWGIILLVLTVLSLVSPITDIMQKQNVSANISILLGGLLDAIVLFDYVKCAKALAKEN